MESEAEGKPLADFLSGEYGPITPRGIEEATAKKYGYFYAENRKGDRVQVATFHSPDGKRAAQKYRTKDKKFVVIGDMKKAGLFGQHLFRDGGQYITITEGELDAMSVAQSFDLKYPVVSLRNGAAGAKKDIQAQLEWLLKFQNVIFFFDNDKPGQEAAEECARLLPPGRAKIARVHAEEGKDANDLLKAGKKSKILQAFWDAKEYRPDGIINGADLWGEMTAAEEEIYCLDYPWPSLNEKTLGQRSGEMVCWTSGSGMGKSTAVKEVEYHNLMAGDSIGVIHLEENRKKTAKILMGMYLNRRIHLDLTPWLDLSDDEQQARQEAFKATAGCGHFFIYDHWGSASVDTIVDRIRYLANGCGCRWVFLDHVSIVVSDQEEGDERKLLDRLATKLRTVVEETGVGLHIICHLKRPEGKGHEEGGQTSLSQLRGSAGIGQLCDIVIGLERDQQDEARPNVVTVRLLKNRWTGETGVACQLYYDRETGRMSEYREDMDLSRKDTPSEDDNTDF